MDMLQRLLEIIAAKVRILNERRQQYRGDITEFGHSDVAQFLLLQNLNIAYCRLQHISQHPQQHPEFFYRALLEIAGGLCAFSQEQQVTGMAAYHHEDLTSSFSHLAEQLGHLLEAVIPARMAPITLRKESDALFVADSIESALFNQVTMFIAVYYQAEDVRWIDQFSRQIKAGARQEIESIVASALPGVTISHTQRPPNKLHIKTGYEYFRLEPTGDFWQQVREEKSLAIFLPHGFINAKIELVTVQE